MSVYKISCIHPENYDRDMVRTAIVIADGPTEARWILSIRYEDMVRNLTEELAEQRKRDAEAAAQGIEITRFYSLEDDLESALRKIRECFDPKIYRVEYLPVDQLSPQILLIDWIYE